MSSFTKREFERFWSQVALPDGNGCMLWTGRQTPKGYGKVFIEGRHQEAHRFSLRHFEGEPPRAGLHAAHSCVNHHCAAPAHLRWATPKQNEADKGIQATRGDGPRGEDVCTARLTNAQAQEIRSLAASGMSREALRVRFGVSKTTIGEVVRGNRYKVAGAQ